MKLSKDQASAIFDLIKDEINSKNRKEVKAIIAKNKRMEIDAIEKFKKTPEYAAIELLRKSFPSINTFGEMIKPRSLHILARKMFNVKLASTYRSVYEEIPNIHLLAIDCKNLAQLKDAVSKHYNVKIK